MSLLETREGRLRVVDHAGDNFLGGKDIDPVLVDWTATPRVASRHFIRCRGLPMVIPAVKRPPPPPPLRRAPPPPPPLAGVPVSGKTTRLYTQGIQAAVQAHPGPDMSPGATPFSDISTQSLSSYIDHNLSERSSEEPSALTRADPQLVDDLIERSFSLDRLSPWAQRGLFAGVASLLTVAVCWFAWGRSPPVTVAPVAERPVAPGEPSPPTAAPAPPAAPARPAAAPVAAAPAPVAAAPAGPSTARVPAPKATPAAPAAVAAAVLPTARCSAQVTSRPAGAEVAIGDRVLGKTPLEVSGQRCGETLTITRPRYSPATATLSPTSGTLAVRLERPRGQLMLTSTPPNAKLKIGRTVLGSAPQSVTVQRFERVRLEAKLPGHRTWQKVVYVTSPLTKLNAALTPRSR